MWQFLLRGNHSFQGSRVQCRGSNSIILCSENRGTLTPNTVSPNCVLSRSESTRRGREGRPFTQFSALLSSLPPAQRATASPQATAALSLSHLSLHRLRCPLRGCLTDLLQQVVNLEAQWLDLLVPGWQSFASCKKEPHKTKSVLVIPHLLNYNLLLWLCPHLPHRQSLPRSYIVLTSASKATMILVVCYKSNSCLAKEKWAENFLLNVFLQGGWQSSHTFLEVRERVTVTGMGEVWSPARASSATSWP